ncbi:hypothetical protein G6F52_010988 [Rhizopus delemar]|nr:hypothetical protein G6F52_010988 [Rhizopus delemar]
MVVENGPCPLVAICNVLFLRGDLEIQPVGRELVTFEYLVERLGDYLLNHIHEEHDQLLEDTLNILPKLKSGLDVNILFDSIHGFEPTPELSMFELFGVDLVHGWIVDPQDTETYEVIVKSCKNYNQTVECIVQANESRSDNPPTQIEEEKLHQAFVADEFLKDTATQLTYYGLELLLAAIPEDDLCVLFRNNHFSTIYRHPEFGLLMLVTDSGFIKEKSVTWESLGDVDQGSSEFFNDSFRQYQQHPPLNEHEDIDLDHAIAISLQQQQLQEQQHHQQQQQQQQHQLNQQQQKHQEL